MKSICQFIALLTLLGSVAQLSYGDVVDRCVAIVNDDVITLSEVNEEGKNLFQRVAEQAPPSERAEALKQVRKTVVDKLIDKKIMYQEAKKANLSVSEEEIDRALEHIMTRNKTTQEQFLAQLTEMGITEEQYRKNLKSQVLSSKLVNYEVRSKVIISESKIIDYYDNHYTERVGEGGFYILQMGFIWDNDVPESETLKKAAKEKAGRIQSLAVADKDFRELARQYSELPSAADGGDIGVVKKDDMSTIMFNTISETKPGKISQIIETPSGYQFFKVLSSQEGQIITKVPYESVKDEIYDTMYQQEIEARFEDWLKKTKSQSYIEIL